MEDDYTIADLLSTLPAHYRRQITGSTPADNRIRLEMVRRLAPRVVLAYGPLPPPCHGLVEVETYPTRWEGIRKARVCSTMRSTRGR